MSILEITLLVLGGIGLTIYITVILVKYFKKRNKNKKEDED